MGLVLKTPMPTHTIAALFHRGSNDRRLEALGRAVGQPGVLAGPFLGGAEQSGVFLTDKSEGGKPQTAIKLVLAGPVDADGQLRQWKAAAELDHPNVMRVLESGRCEVGGADFLYVLAEYAEESLSQILPQRALTGDETRQVLDAALKGLAYIHSKGLVHGRVRPSNVLAVGDVVKLSSDSVRTAGEGKGPNWDKSTYDAPEAAIGEFGPAADIWSLGVTLVEVMTQRLSAPDSVPGRESSLLAGIQEPFQEIARHCLQVDPRSRWTVGEIAARLGGGGTERIGAQTVPQEPVVQARSDAAASRAWDARDRNRFAKWPYALALVGVVVVAAVLMLKPKPVSPAGAGPGSGAVETSSVSAESGSNEGANSQTNHDEMATKRGGRDGVVGRVIPRVSPGARHTITGKIRVAVSVNVDTAGNVTEARLQSAGPSKYFARLALEAARGWKFKPALTNGTAGPSEWVLRFGFSRRRTEGSAQRKAP